MTTGGHIGRRASTPALVSRRNANSSSTKFFAASLTAPGEVTVKAGKVYYTNREEDSNAGYLEQLFEDVPETVLDSVVIEGDPVDLVNGTFIYVVLARAVPAPEYTALDSNSDNWKFTEYSHTVTASIVALPCDDPENPVEPAAPDNISAFYRLIAIYFNDDLGERVEQKHDGHVNSPQVTWPWFD